MPTSTASPADAPTKPFEWRILGGSGDKGGTPQFAVPFDEEWRDAEKPNVEDRVLPALISLGHAVASSPEKYCPAFRVVRVVNVRLLNSKAEADKLAAEGDDHIVVIDRRNGKVTHLDLSYSPREAAVSWFARTPGHDDSILCLDRQEGHYYVEAQRPELIIAISAEGVEVPPDEPHVRSSYRIDQHPNAIMAHGE